MPPHTRIPLPPNLSIFAAQEGWKRAPFSLQLKTQRHSFRLITEKHSPVFVVSTTDVFSSTTSVLSCWMQSKRLSRLDTRSKNQSLQDACACNSVCP
ncbi:hypothetical protein TNCV_356691 [Trichonephila clavipes]|nr:hypothetical protein TNCV_356691 [Trichonephila clavipes]